MPAVIVDPTRAREAGWEPRYDFESGLAGGLGGVAARRPRAVAAGAPAATVPAGDAS